jgi:hypothetical protein
MYRASVYNTLAAARLIHTLRPARAGFSYDAPLRATSRPRPFGFALRASASYGIDLRQVTDAMVATMTLVVAIVAPGTMGAGVGKRLTNHGVRVLTSLTGRREANAGRARAVALSDRVRLRNRRTGNASVRAAV